MEYKYFLTLEFENTCIFFNFDMISCDAMNDKWLFLLVIQIYTGRAEQGNIKIYIFDLTNCPR